MKLMKLTLNNFQGIRSLSLDFGGRSAAVYGDNATGKTTVYNAFTWLLFDAPSSGAKNFTPKTRGKDGDLHNLEHSVEAVFKADSGRELTLKKVFSEVYQKKRGSAEARFSGHTVAYYVDGVPEKQKEYELVITTLFGDRETMKQLTMPDYFPERLPWEERRKLLLEICGGVTDEEVIASSPELRELRDCLRLNGTEYSVEDYRKVATAKQKDINKRLGDIPGRIDEAQRAIPDISGLDEGEINIRIAELTAEKEALAEKKAWLMTSGGEEIRRKLAELDTKAAMAGAEHARRSLAANSEVTAKLIAARSEETKIEAEIKRLDALVSSAKRRIEDEEAEQEKLRVAYSRIYDEKWDEAKAVCPTCGRELPPERVDELRSDFNKGRSSRLMEINAKGKRNSSLIDSLKSELAEAEAGREKAEKELETAIRRVKTLEGAVVAPTPFESTEEYAAMEAQKAELEELLRDEDAAMKEAEREVNGEIAAAEAELDRQREGLSLLSLAKTQEGRVKELTDEERRLSGEYEELEKGLYLCGLFTKTKVAALTERINSRFRSVRFRLFREQINGGIAEDCEVMIPSPEGSLVPYSTANNAARINAGLEIISVLSDSLGVSMPVFVDNAESVTRLLETDMQVIRLTVNEADKTLRLEAGA